MNDLKASPLPPQSAVPAATDRVTEKVSMLEHVLEALEKRLLSVLEPAVPQGAAGTQSAPAHPVPLANTLHVVADRVGSLVDKAESLLNRLHV